MASQTGDMMSSIMQLVMLMLQMMMQFLGGQGGAVASPAQGMSTASGGGSASSPGGGGAAPASGSSPTVAPSGNPDQLDALPLDRQYVDKPSESGDFGERTPPTAGASSFHKGDDFGAPIGTPIYSAKAGTVVSVENSSSAGKYVVVDHGNGLQTRYLHMNAFTGANGQDIQVGQQVAAGEQIGEVGNTGIGTGAHLHFEVIKNGEKVDPWPYLQALGAA